MPAQVCKRVLNEAGKNVFNFHENSQVSLKFDLIPLR